jgi:sarcosine oxidase
VPAENHFDVIVLGVGSMGSAACWYLSKHGVSVLGLEQFEIAHDKGSHSGQSRIIRKAYFEHPDYVPLLQRAYHNWNEIERQSSTQIYYKTGIVYFGKPHSETIAGTKKSASLYDISIESISQIESRNRFTELQIPSTFETIVEPDAGFVTPERAIRTYVDQARKHGAIIKSNIRVKQWKEEKKKFIISTDTENYTCDKLVITAGSWTSKIVPNLKTELKVTRQTLAWIKPKNIKRFSLGNFPCWFVEDPQLGLFYGFPALPQEKFEGNAGMKFAHHHPAESTDPDLSVTNVSVHAKKNLQTFLEKYMPGITNESLTFSQCLYTYSPDTNFIIDHLPGYDKSVTIACGFSGHGFKFVSVVGEILADLAIKGKTEQPIDFLSLKRFTKL